MFKRKSKKREEILSVLKKTGLISAPELVGQLKHIDRATIYRNLEKFVQEGIVREVRIKKGLSTYEFINESHQHIICEDCEEIQHIDINQEALKRFLLHEDPNLRNYDIKDIELNIRGLFKHKKSH